MNEKKREYYAYIRIYNAHTYHVALTTPISYTVMHVVTNIMCVSNYMYFKWKNLQTNFIQESTLSIDLSFLIYRFLFVFCFSLILDDGKRVQKKSEFFFRTSTVSRIFFFLRFAFFSHYTLNAKQKCKNHIRNDTICGLKRTILLWRSTRNFMKKNFSSLLSIKHYEWCV